MNIGIITQPLCSNYGGTLQNYALQQALRKLGHRPITLDYQPCKGKFRTMLSLALTLFLFFTSKRRTFKECLPLKRDKLINHFICSYINSTPVIKKYYSSLIDDYSLDAIVVGSDQVWRPIYNSGVLLDMYLNFTKNYNIKRLSYAASFGTPEWEYNEKERIACKKLIEKFDGVSVREYSGVNLCNKYFGVNAVKVLDPTLLLSRLDYEKIVGSCSMSKFLFSYILDVTEDKNNYCKTLSAHLQLSHKRCGISSPLSYSIEDWLANINAADFIVTDSFHGTVFSLIFHKNFIALNNYGRGSARIHDLLCSVGLEDRIIDSKCDPKDVFSKFSLIHWDDVDKKLQLQRESSLDFLTNIL